MSGGGWDACVCVGGRLRVRLGGGEESALLPAQAEENGDKKPKTGEIGRY